MVRYLKQPDQASDQLQFDHPRPGGIHQGERFARLDVLITEMESQQKAPITAADLTIPEMMRIDGTPQSLTIEIPPAATTRETISSAVTPEEGRSSNNWLKQPEESSTTWVCSPSAQNLPRFPGLNRNRSPSERERLTIFALGITPLGPIRQPLVVSG